MDEFKVGFNKKLKIFYHVTFAVAALITAGMYIAGAIAGAGLSLLALFVLGLYQVAYLFNQYSFILSENNSSGLLEKLKRTWVSCGYIALVFLSITWQMFSNEFEFIPSLIPTGDDDFRFSGVILFAFGILTLINVVVQVAAALRPSLDVVSDPMGMGRGGGAASSEPTFDLSDTSGMTGTTGGVG